METVNITLDSHEKYKQLLAKGFTEEQAEGIVGLFSEISLPNVATKHDVAILKGDIQNIRDQIKDSENSLRQEMKDLETRLTKLIFVNTFTTIAIIAALFKFL